MRTRAPRGLLDAEDDAPPAPPSGVIKTGRYKNIKLKPSAKHEPAVDVVIGKPVAAIVRVKPRKRKKPVTPIKPGASPFDW